MDLISAPGIIWVLYIKNSLHRHRSNKKKLFLAVYIICIMHISFRKSPHMSALGREDSCYLVAEERHSKIHCNKLFLLPFTAALPVKTLLNRLVLPNSAFQIFS